MIETAPQPTIVIPGCAECQDDWTWLVRYTDGSILLECGGAQRRHAAYADIDLARVERMALLPMRDGLNQYVVKMSEHMQPIFFRRRYVELQIADGQQVARQTIHCLGYQLNPPRGAKSEHYLFVLQDGSCLLTSDRKAL